MELGGSVDGTNPAPVEVGSLSQYLEGAIHPRWCRISEPSTVGTRPSLFRSLHIFKTANERPSYMESIEMKLVVWVGGLELGAFFWG